MENHYFMKLTIPSIYKKQIAPFIIFVSLALFIWFLGPLLVVANYTPLAYPDKRLYIIAAFFLLWVLKFIFFDTTPAKNKYQQPQFSPETAKKLQTLQGRFQGALNFLKKTVINKQGSRFHLSTLSWYLFIGASGSGKTTLLANSKVNFILSKQFKQAEAVIIPSSDACDWWVTRDLVLIDVPGYYFMGREKPSANHPEKNKDGNILWKSLLNLIKITPAKDNLNGIIIALNFPEMLKKSSAQEKNALIHDLKKRITELRNQFGSQLAFHFVITKCDLLPGFLEFFSETGSEELSQAWGLTMPELQPKDKLLDVFTLRFNALIKRINKQLLLRLHQERNPNARPYIKDFPLHLERLKEAITTLLKALAMPDLHLQGVYLTSAAQPPAEEPVSYTHVAHSNLTHQPLQIMRAPTIPSRAYFVKQLVMQSFLYTSRQVSLQNQSDYTWLRRATYAISIGIIVTATLLLGHDFKRSIEKTYTLQNDLTRYQMYVQENDPSDVRLIKALPLLDNLQQAANNSHHQLVRIESILAFYTNRSQQTANVIYFKALQTIVIPEIKNDLENFLANASNKNPVLVYTALKAYLMMTDPENFQASFLTNTISKITSTPMNSTVLSRLTSHVNAIFSTHLATVQLNQNLITDVRKQLVNLPSTELGFVILKSMDANNADSTIGLGTNFGSPPVFVSKQVDNRIPNMFVAANFQKILADEINSAATEALKGNWVLGDIMPSVNQPSLDSLTSQLRNQYIAKYVDIWESQLANIQPYTPKNLLQVDEMILNLTNNNSPLLQLLQTIKENTGFDPIISSSPKIMALDNLVNSDIKQSSLYEAFVDLRQLHFYLQKILNSANSNKNAFDAASSRLQNLNDDPITAIHKLAEQNPEPLKSWLNIIANQSWDFILQKAGTHIQTAWKTNILPTYNEHIANRYPFVQNSDKDVSLQEFTNFLGHRGLLANFYLNYLKPFVDDKGSQWTWRTIDNQRIPFSNELLANLQHAAQLQHVFFPNGDNKLSIEFTMQPIALDPQMRTLTLNINGQQAAFQKNGKRLPRTFTWPGNYYSHGTTVSFITPKSQMISNTLKGDWGLFRLINSSTEGINDKKALMLNIAANGHSAKYMLFTNASMNPFLPNSISHFELPQDILRS